MPGSVWPDEAVIVAPDHGIGAAGDVSRTPFDDGYVSQRRIYTTPWITRQISAIVTHADYLAVRGWMRRHASERFAFRDPDDGAWRAVIVRGGLAGVGWRQEAAAPGEPRWRLRCLLEGADVEVSVGYPLLLDIPGNPELLLGDGTRILYHDTDFWPD